ncbi:MAG TPA: hypothetical protein VKC63_07755 [Solirubrobacterales bacterium]|nr:hypothetical protein [Solirubrobacterales bacterium]
MKLRIPATIEIDQQGLQELRALLDMLASEESSVEPVASRGDSRVDLPPRWRMVEERHGVTYTWGGDHDVYDPFRIYAAEISSGAVRLAIGRCERTRTFGQDRIYYIVVSIGPEGGMRAISEFLAADDYAETHEVIAIIKGRGGSGRQFDRPEELPSVYADWSTVTYRDRVDYPGSYLKQALVCSEQDHETMLNHSLAQIQLRHLDA